MNFWPSGTVLDLELYASPPFRSSFISHPAEVSGQHIPEGFLKETRVIVFIGAKGFLFYYQQDGAFV